MTTPAHAKSKTPRTDAAGVYWNSLPKLATSAQVTYADFARQLEIELNAAHIQAEADRHELAAWVQAAAKEAVDNIEKYEAAQQRIKELEADGRRLEFAFDNQLILSMNLNLPRPFLDTNFRLLDREDMDAAMSREQKEGEAK